MIEQFQGDKEDFLDFAMRNVYYLNPIKVENKWRELREQILLTKKGVIRHTATVFTTGRRQSAKEYTKVLLEDGKLELFIIADKDGNAEVRKIFKELTGILSSFGKTSNVTNYTLTHIWGMTDNPFAFTAPWNIAMASTFIAPLTDGKPGPEHVRHIFQSTFRAVAWLLYCDIDDSTDRIPSSLLPTKEYFSIAQKMINNKTVRVLE